MLTMLAQPFIQPPARPSVLRADTNIKPEAAFDEGR